MKLVALSQPINKGDSNATPEKGITLSQFGELNFGQFCKSSRFDRYDTGASTRRGVYHRHFANMFANTASSNLTFIDTD